MGPVDWIAVGSGVATAISGLAWHWILYKKRINQIADDIQWHVGFRDRIS